MSNTNTTITDKKSFSCKVIDKEKFEKLSQEDKECFELLRNSLLEIFPVNENTYDTDSIKFAENFAFINLKGISAYIDKKIDTKLETFKTEILSTVSTMMTAAPTGGETK